MAKQSNWQRYSASGTKALQSRDLDTAESMWLAAMEEATDFIDTDPRLAHTLESLAEVYYRRGNLDMASRYCQRVLDVCEKTLGPEHPDIGVLAHNLAMLHHMQCRFMEAEPLYKKAMTVRTKALGSKHPEVMRLLEGYADLLEKMHRGEEARHLKQCIDGMSTGRWTRSGRWTIFSSSGGAPGAPGAAEAAAISARAQAESNAAMMGAQGASSTMAQLRQNQNVAMQQQSIAPGQGPPKSAIDMVLRKTEPEARRHSGETSTGSHQPLVETTGSHQPLQEMTDSHQNMPPVHAASNSQQGMKSVVAATQHEVPALRAPTETPNRDQYDSHQLKAPREPRRDTQTQRTPQEPQRKDSQVLRAPQEPPRRPTAESRNNIAAVARQPQPDRDEQDATLPLAPARAQNATHPPAPAPAQNDPTEQSVENWRLFRNFAEHAHSSGNMVVAEQMWRSALQEADTFGVDPRLAYTLDSLADVLAKLKRYDDAELYLRRAIDLKINAVGRDHIAVAFSTSSLAKLYYWKGDYKQAVMQGKECVRIYDNTSGPDHPDTACALYNLALIYHFKDNYDEAEKAYKRALTIRQQTLGEQHPDTIKVQTNYAKLLHLKQKDRSKDQSIISGTWKVLELPPDAQLWLNDVD